MRTTNGHSEVIGTAVYFRGIMRHWTPAAIVNLREKLGVSQVGLGILMGITQQQLQRMEKGASPIRAHWGTLLNYIEQEWDAGRKPIGWADMVNAGGLLKTKETSS